MIHIDIEIKKYSRLKTIPHYCHSKIEDMIFFAIMKLPEKFIPQWLMNRLDKYTTKRISQLKQQTIHDAWRKMYLEKAADEIATRQQDTKKAPSDD